jgi:glycosyltransferase involved in cell wall biosynthesis
MTTEHQQSITPINNIAGRKAPSEDGLSEQLKILFLTNRSPYPIKDGQSRRTYNILKGLACRHEVYLLSLYESAEEVMPESVGHLKSFCKQVEILPAPRKTLSLGMVARLLRSLFSKDPYTVWRHYSRPYMKRVRMWLDLTPFDVVHCDILLLAYCIRDLNGPFRTLTDHDVSYLKAKRLAAHMRNPVLKLFLYFEALKLKQLESRIFSTLDLGIAVSELDRQHLERICPGGRFAVVENGVDVRAFVPDPDAIEPDALVWVGGFHHHPNCEAVRFFLDEIYPRIKREKAETKFYVVGGGIPDWLRRLTTDDPSIVLTGYVDDPLPYIQRAAVFVAPILSGGGTKLKVLEAMAVGKAIVSTSIGVEGIEGKDQEHFMVADGPEAFSSGVVSLLNDRVSRERLGANARKRAMEKYDWEAICEVMSRIYQGAGKQVRDAR